MTEGRINEGLNLLNVQRKDAIILQDLWTIYVEEWIKITSEQLNKHFLYAWGDFKLT